MSTKAELDLAAMTRDGHDWQAAAGMATADIAEEPIEVHWMRRALHAECELLDLAQREERDGKEIVLLVLAIFTGGLVFREVAMAIATAIGGLLS